MALTKIPQALINAIFGGGEDVPIATDAVAGKVKDGLGVTVAADGTLNLDPLPVASDLEFGLVKIGSGINFANGVISVTPGATPIATTTSVGTVQPSADHFAITAGGLMTLVNPGGSGTVVDASSEQKGVVRIGSGINLDPLTATISVPAGSVPLATQNTTGVVKGGNNTTIGADGSINVSLSASSADPVNFTNSAGTAVPPPKESGYTPNADSLQYLERINVARWFDTTQGIDRGEMLNKIMLFAHKIHRLQRRGNPFPANTDQSFYGTQLAPAIEVFCPVGNYFIREQIHVPAGVELNNRGVLYRDPAGFTYLSTTTNPTRAFKESQCEGYILSDRHVPAVSVSPYGHIGMLNIQGHVRGHQEAGSGIATSCTMVPEFATTSRATRNAGMQKVDSGSGYTPNDIITLVQDGQQFKTNADSWRFQPCTIKVISVLVNGSPSTASTARGPISEWEVQQPGQWDIAISAVEKKGHYSNGTSGSGATFKPIKYQQRWLASAWGNGQDQGIYCQTRIRDLNCIECGRDKDAVATKGLLTGALISGLNIEIDRIYAKNCRIGMRMSGGSDVRINNWNTVLCGTAWRIAGYGSVTCSNFALDSSWWCGIELSGCQGIVIRGRNFWENAANDKPFNTDGTENIYGRPFQSGAAIAIGQGGSVGQLCSGLNLQIQMTSVGGHPDKPLQPAVKLDGVTKSTFDFGVTNSNYSGRIYDNTKLVKCLIEFGNITDTTFTDKERGVNRTYSNYRRLQEDNVITGYCNDIAGPLYTGDPRGNYLNLWDPQIKGMVGPYGTYTVWSQGAPGTLSGTSASGAGKVGTGSIWKRTTQGTTLEWINTGTRSSPTWTPR